ncbi:uncharacterized protein LACBIDRAFT_304976 [Laccaria bicolor S238N-H82]|uniref:RBR-type E3 ubiquitin transferase n=1 Tax=Laccaria bicolor (strain S238N-H82 / ATCC MYA-4686) TaxID=486041 RepID=B0CT33_LACBS|nr:uncharacterized protein LACBIDRAFT_304976 [Laccaria bicolor S238N-H82]EDR14433.1 predicted protein [Laccaria bicolor S238N-H82]|eukprot:XP_001874992.1 predicted protein [Laccaria bicolor S238N-H82]
MPEESLPQGTSGTYVSPTRQSCRYFLNGGHCPFGERCRYLHIKRSEMPPSHPRATGQYKRGQPDNQEGQASFEMRTSLEDPLSNPRSAAEPRDSEYDSTALATTIPTTVTMAPASTDPNQHDIDTTQKPKHNMPGPLNDRNVVPHVLFNQQQEQGPPRGGGYGGPSRRGRGRAQRVRNSVEATRSQKQEEEEDGTPERTREERGDAQLAGHAPEEGARRSRIKLHVRAGRDEAERKVDGGQEEAAWKIRVEQEEIEQKAKEERQKLARKAREKREEKIARKVKGEREEAARKAKEEREEAVRKAREQREEAERRAWQAQLAERRAQEARVTVQQVVLGSSLVTCGAGINILSVIGAFDLCRILVKRLPKKAKANEVVEIFSQQGVDPKDFFLLHMKRNDGHTEATVLVRVEQGEAMALGLDGVEFRDKHLQVEVSANASWGSSSDNSKTLTINWKNPSTTIIATYTSIDQARVMAKELDGQICNGRKVRAVMDQPRRGLRHNPGSIKLTNLLPNVPLADIEQFSKTSCLQTVSSPTYDAQEFTEFLHSYLEDCPGVVPQSFVSMPSNERDDNVRVKVRFHTWEAAKSVSDTLDKTKLPGRHDYPLLKTSIPHVQYKSQSKLWNSLMEGRENGMAGLHIHQRPNGRVIIKVTGDDKKAVGALKVRVESLVGGERLDASYWHHSLLSAAGQRFLRQVHTTCGAYVRTDTGFESLRRYRNVGQSQGVDQGRSQKALVPGEAALKDVLGEDNVSLDLASTPCKLIIKGGDEALHPELLDELLTNSRLDKSYAANGDDICIICYDTVSHPESLGCGHTYCTTCLRHYLTSAPDTKKFPLVCMGNEATCDTPISIPIIKKFLTEQRFNNLIEVAFLSYLDQHPQEFGYCTTPDCSQIYQSNSTKTVLQCPSCFSTICPSCHVEAHKGMTCDERKLHEQERLTKEWAATNGVKKCPTCSGWLEKTEGCNHMSCKCGAHICWRCMGVFTAETIYDHMRREHEGIYDVAPQWANQPGPNNVHALVVDDRFVAAQEAELERLELRRAQRLATPRERVEEAVRENLRRRRQEMERHIVAQEEVLEAQRG